jgi:hypothetical protein
MSACKPARSADWHSQACGTSHWSLSRASSLLMPRHAPPTRTHASSTHCIILRYSMHNPRPQQHRMQQPERLAHPPQQQAQRPRRSMRAEAVPDSSQQELVAAALHHLPRNMHNPCPQQHRMQQPKRLAHPPQQQPQRPRRSMRAQAVPDSSYVSWWQQRSNPFLFPTPAN